MRKTCSETKVDCVETSGCETATGWPKTVQSLAASRAAMRVG